MAQLPTPISKLTSATRNLKEIVAPNLLRAAVEIDSHTVLAPGPNPGIDPNKVENLKKAYEEARKHVADARAALVDIQDALGQLGVVVPMPDAPGAGGEPIPAPQGPPDAGKDETRLSLSGFFASVGEGLIGAQRALDQQSEQYVRSLGDRATALPSVFRVPKVSAELQFAIEIIDEKRIDIIFAAKESSQRRAMQQKIAFDIVAMPPPVELLDGTADRRAIAVRLKDSAASDGTIADRISSALADAVVLRGGQSWLVARRLESGAIDLALIPYGDGAIELQALQSDEASENMLANEWLRQILVPSPTASPPSK